MAIKLFQGKLVTIADVKYRVEFITRKWVLLSQEGTRFHLVSIEDIHIGNPLAITAHDEALLKPYAKEPDLYHMIQLYEDLSGDPAFTEVTEDGFYNTKYYSTIYGFLEYTYMVCKYNRAVLCTAMAHSELLIPAGVPTYRWTNPDVNGRLNALVAMEKSQDPADKQKLLNIYLVLKARIANPESVDCGFSLLPLSVLCPTPADFIIKFPGVAVVENTEAERTRHDNFWLSDPNNSGKITTLVYTDYANAVDGMVVLREEHTYAT